MNRLPIILSISALVISCTCVLADTVRHGGAAHSPSPSPSLSPYSDFSGRDIKALSAEQIEDYQAGRGMGMALAAELNQYPGPRHVLDLAGQLQLNPQQQQQTRQLFEQMQAQAKVLGRQIIEGEGELDRMFADRSIDSETLSAKLAAIARQQGELRNVHLATHLKMREILTPHQIHLYAQLRGYGSGGHQHGTHH
jgi:Spy/CpxP family protein refolding chaperone